MKQTLAAGLCVVICAICVAAPTAKLALRQQYGRDAEVMLRAEAGREPPPTVDIAKVVEEAVAAMEREVPGVFLEQPAPEIPTDDVLRSAHAAAMTASGEIPRTPFWHYYIDRWKADTLKDAQRVLFLRFLQAYTNRKLAEKREYGMGMNRRDR